MSRTPPISLRKVSKTQKFDYSGLSNYYYFNQLKHYLTTSENITHLSKTLISPILEPKKGLIHSKIDEPVFQFNLLPLQLLFKMANVNISAFENSRSFFNTKSISNGCANALLSTRLNNNQHFKKSHYSFYSNNKFKLCNPFYLIQSLVTNSNNKIFKKPLRLDEKLKSHYNFKIFTNLRTLSLKTLTYAPIINARTQLSLSLNSNVNITSSYICNDHLMTFLCKSIPSYLLTKSNVLKYSNIKKKYKVMFKPMFDTYFYGYNSNNFLMLAISQQLIDDCNNIKTQTQAHLNKKLLHPKSLKVSLLRFNNSKQNIINNERSFLVNDPKSYTNFLSYSSTQKIHVGVSNTNEHGLKTNSMPGIKEKAILNSSQVNMKYKLKDYLNMSQTQITPTIKSTFSARFNSPQYLHNFFLINSRLPRNRYDNKIMIKDLNSIKSRIKNYNVNINNVNKYYNVFDNNIKTYQSLVTFELIDSFNGSNNPAAMLEKSINHNMADTKLYSKILSIRL